MARRRPGLIAGLSLGAVLAFPVGLMLGRGAEPAAERTAPRAPAGDGAMRNFYSPHPISDPAFLAAQRENAEALEGQCRRSGEFCAEAAALRRWLEEHGGQN